MKFVSKRKKMSMTDLPSAAGVGGAAMVSPVADGAGPLKRQSEVIELPLTAFYASIHVYHQTSSHH